MAWLNSGGTNGWLTVRLRGVTSNRDGIGARVEVTAGGQTQVREVSGGEGFMSHSLDLSAHVGLGTAQTADVTVRWPSGHVDTLPGVGRNQTLTVVEGVGRNEPPSPFALSTPADGTASEPTVMLTWESAADAEGDAVAYTVLLSGPDGDQERSAGTDTSLVLPTLSDGAYRWTVVARDAYGVRTSLDPFRFSIGVVAGEGAPPPQELSVHVSPNPSATDATVVLTAPRGVAVRLVAYDALGREVAVLLDEEGAGERSVGVDVSRWPAGVYVVRAESGSQPGPRESG
jgi:hypothetical protein